MNYDELSDSTAQHMVQKMFNQNSEYLFTKFLNNQECFDEKHENEHTRLILSG